MNTAEIEFLAEQELITMIPKFSDHRLIHLITGDIGPFRAGIPSIVPVWVAINLRIRRKCTIVAPDWMNADTLELIIEEEKNNRLFTKMPSDHYMTIAHLIFKNASEDIENTDRIRTLIKDLWDLRIAKARSSADAFLKGGGRHAGIDHLTHLEICTLRPLLLDALDTIHHLSMPLDDPNFMKSSTLGSQSQSLGSVSMTHTSPSTSSRPSNSFGS